MPLNYKMLKGYRIRKVKNGFIKKDKRYNSKATFFFTQNLYVYIY